MPADRQAAAEILAWYAEMGVDVALEETPVDRLSAPVEMPAGPPPPALAETVPLPEPRRPLAPPAAPAR